MRTLIRIAYDNPCHQNRSSQLSKSFILGIKIAYSCYQKRSFLLSKSFIPAIKIVHHCHQNRSSLLLKTGKRSSETFTAQKMKFSIKDFFSRCDQIRGFLRIWSHLLKKSSIENILFCAVLCCQKYSYLSSKRFTKKVDQKSPSSKTFIKNIL